VVGPRRFPLRSFVFLTALLLAAFLARSLWLPWLAWPLIRDEGPAKADIAVVLAGDYYGHRIEKAAELVRAGYVPAALVSGPSYYGVHECDLAIAMMVARGCPAQWFIPLPNATLSTREEAAAVLAELRRRRVNSFLLVTSTYHSARAARTYRATERAQGGGPELRVVTAPDEHFQPQSWWRGRESQKIVFIEWWKTVAAWLGK